MCIQFTVIHDFSKWPWCKASERNLPVWFWKDGLTTAKKNPKTSEIRIKTLQNTAKTISKWKCRLRETKFAGGHIPRFPLRLTSSAPKDTPYFPLKKVGISEEEGGNGERSEMAVKTAQRRYHTNQCIHKVVISVVTKPLQIYVNVNVHDVKTHKIQVLFERRYMGYLQTWLMKKLSLWWKNAYVQCSCIIPIILFFPNLISAFCFSCNIAQCSVDVKPCTLSEHRSSTRSLRASYPVMEGEASREGTREGTAKPPLALAQLLATLPNGEFARRLFNTQLRLRQERAAKNN